MKKKKYIPKYYNGGTSGTINSRRMDNIRPGVNTSRGMYSGNESAMGGNQMYIDPNVTGDIALQDNTGYSGQSSKQGMSAGQYAQAGSAIIGGGTQAYMAGENDQLNSLEKTRGIQAGADTAKVGVAGAINPALGMAVGAVTNVGSKMQTRLDKTDENGNIINKEGSKAGEVVGGFLSPSNSLIGIFSDPNATTGQKVAGALTGGISDMFTNRHKKQVESSAKEGLFRQGGKMCYPNGGMMPNAEIEKQENVVLPNGGFMQADGPSHEQGGIPVNLPNKALIFSDKLKMPGTNKTYAKLNMSNNTNKEDKILTGKSINKLSRSTAELMKFAKNKASQDLFDNQEELKISKVNRYAQRLGVIPSQDNTMSVDINEFKYGGKQPNLYRKGGTVPVVPKESWEPMQSINVMNPNTNISNEDYWNAKIAGTYDDNGIGYSQENKYGESNPDNLELKGNPQIQDSGYDNPIDPSRFNKQPRNPNSKFNSKDFATQAAYFAANNAGNIYNLSRYNKPEVETYERLKGNYLDPRAAIRDANMEGRIAEKGIRDASGGNAGTYLSNRLGLTSKIIQDKDRIRQQYENANAGIGNQVNQFNTQLAQQEVIANAQNRARNRSGKGEAIGSMGFNTANQMKDNRLDNMDQNTLDIMMKYYNTPAFQKAMKDNKFKK